MIRLCPSRRLFAPVAALAILPALAPAQDASQDPTVPSDAMRELIVQPERRGPESRSVVEIKVNPDDPSRFDIVRFYEVPLAQAVGELGKATDANVAVSESVADQEVTMIFRNVDLDGVLKGLAFSQGLVKRHDEVSDIHFLATADEFRDDLSTFRTTRTEVFTLLYPNANDVVRVIGDTFGERVIVTEEDQEDDDTLLDLENRFQRFETLESRSRGLSSIGGGTSIRTFSSSSTTTERNDDRGRGIPEEFSLDDLPELTPAEARMLAEAQAGAEEAAADARRLATRGALTYVSAIQRLNRVVVRSGDPKVLEDIRTLIERLDVPTPLVLLEVRVLRIDLSDGLDSSFDFAFQAPDARAGDFGGAFSSGEIAVPDPGSILPGGTGVNLGAGVFQVVSNNFQVRLQLLQSKGRVTSLATPIILTANGEVSRIFSGEQVPIVIGFTEPQLIVGDGATTTLSSTPITELRDVGTDLLLTANINADRTVTLRLLQETSSVNEDGASILVPTGTSFISQTVDTVQSQSASGTIVAQDGLLLAFGGLIEETETDLREQLPVLGDLPLVGFLFRRETSVINRSELIVLVRPYVMSTPLEGDAISRNLLESLSIHPYRPGKGATTGDEDDWGVFRNEQPPFDRSIFDLFRFHTVPSFNQDTPSGGLP